MNKIFLTSDLHLCHNKSFLYEPRGFFNIDEMNKAIVKNWNEIVDDDDTIYILGDIMLNDNITASKYFNQLKGWKHIILGNHDTDERKKLYQNLRGVLSIDYASILKYEGFSFFLCHYPTITSSHNVEKKLKSRLINLCGHSHTKDKFADWDKGYIYHCELDAHDNRPVLIDNIINDIRDKI